NALGGDFTMKDKRLSGMALLEHLRSGNIVDEFYIGNVHIIIRDTYYRDRTKEEINQSWTNFCIKTTAGLNNTFANKSIEECNQIWEKNLKIAQAAAERCGEIRRVEKGKT
ncbi:MAG: hypothetical protein RR263_04865, partial [Oscillospiraceae bacterium]